MKNHIAILSLTIGIFAPFGIASASCGLYEPLGTPCNPLNVQIQETSQQKLDRIHEKLQEALREANKTQFPVAPVFNITPIKYNTPTQNIFTPVFIPVTPSVPGKEHRTVEKELTEKMSDAEQEQASQNLECFKASGGKALEADESGQGCVCTMSYQEWDETTKTCVHKVSTEEQRPGFWAWLISFFRA